ncbi:MAG: fumarate reductase cytochrome b subunit [Zoogloeaceae bacterium]|jgi:fumarate reductase subunit C|nr:fumarate reductase cytochrome b subunit [Zoogloeaceae bacterium]
MHDGVLIAQSGLAGRGRKSRWPARLDLLQSLTGLLLALFVCAHLFFDSSILLGKDAMWAVSKFYEGYFVFGKAHPWLVSMVAGTLCVVFMAHALLALRKFPINYRQYRTFHAHARAMRHGDTRLWLWQVYTGFLLFFLASAHLYQMFFWPQAIGPHASSDRIWSDGHWPFYSVFLIAVVLHAVTGLYRLAVKWGRPGLPRPTLRTLRRLLTAFFLALGFAALATYMKIGYDHRDHYGERYHPAGNSPVDGDSPGSVPEESSSVEPSRFAGQRR